MNAMQKIKLSKERVSLIASLKSGELKAIAKIKASKRVAEIVVLLGGKTTASNPENIQSSSDGAVQPDNSILAIGDNKAILNEAYNRSKSKYANKEPVPIKVISDGRLVMVGWQGLKHGLSDKGNVTKALASTCIEDLVKHSTFVKKLDNKKPNLKETLLYQAMMKDANGTKPIGLMIHVLDKGSNLYDYFKLNTNKNPASTSDERINQPLAGSKDNLTQFDDSANSVLQDETDVVQTEIYVLADVLSDDEFNQLNAENPLYQSILDGADITVDLIKKTIDEAKNDVNHWQLKDAVKRLVDGVNALAA